MLPVVKIPIAQCLHYWHKVVISLQPLANVKAWWYFYNSTAFRLVADLALLGAVVYVIPVLLSLPQSENLVLGEPNTARARFNQGRIWVRWLGLATLVASLIPPFFYWPILYQVNGKKDDIKTASINSHCVLGLYITTLLAVGLFIWFYIKWQRVSKLHVSFSK
jgi:hypothetical protein